MKNNYKKALDFLEFKRKLLLVLLVVGLFTAVALLMRFYSPEKKTTVVLSGKVVNDNVDIAKNIFKNCVVELSDGRVIVAACPNRTMTRRGTSVEVMAITDKNNNVRYTIVK